MFTLVKCMKLSPYAYLPTRATEASAGLDLKSAFAYTIAPGERKLIPTQLAFQLPEGTYGRIAPRSGLALNYGVDVMGGVIDKDYRGEIKIILINHGKEYFRVNRGDKVAQLICEKIEYPIVIECLNLDETERGAGGFGSTD